MENLKKLEEILRKIEAYETLGGDVPTTKEVGEIFQAILQVIAELKDSLLQKIDEASSDSSIKHSESLSEISSLETKLINLNKKSAEDASGELDVLVKKIYQTVEEVKNLIPEMPDLSGLEGRIGKLEKEEILTDTPEQIVAKLENLEGDKRLSKEAIKGIDELEKKIAQKNSSVGGGSRGFQLYVGGTKKGLAQYIDLIAGSNITISDSLVNGLHSITFASSGGSISTLAATEVPDGNIKVFTFSTASAQPSFIVSDNVWMKATTANGSVNWTWDAGAKQATLTIPPTEDLWAIV